MLEHVPCQNVRFWVVVLCDLCIFSWPHRRSAAGICMPPTTPANPYWPRGALPPGLRFVSNTIILCITKNGTIWIISAVSPGWNSDGESLGKFKTKKTCYFRSVFPGFFYLCCPHSPGEDMVAWSLTMYHPMPGQVSTRRGKIEEVHVLLIYLTKRVVLTDCYIPMQS